MGMARKLKRKEYKLLCRAIRLSIKQKAVWNAVTVADIMNRIRGDVPKYRLRELIKLRYNPPHSELKQLAKRFQKICDDNNIPPGDREEHIHKFLAGWIKGLDNQISSLIEDQ